MNSPKISRVSVFSWRKMGVPVKPMMAALGSALRRLRCRVRVCERCASSTSTRMSSDSLRTGNSSKWMFSSKVTAFSTTALRPCPAVFSLRTMVIATFSAAVSLRHILILLQHGEDDVRRALAQDALGAGSG